MKTDFEVAFRIRFFLHVSREGMLQSCRSNANNYNKNVNKLKEICLKRQYVVYLHCEN